MGHYVADLMLDCADFGFECAKGAHSVILSQIEEGNLTWANPQQIAHVRRSHNYRANVGLNQVTEQYNGANQSGFSTNIKFNSTSVNVKTCKMYQNNTCQASSHHKVGDTLYKHVCAYCYRDGKAYPHPEGECRRKSTGHPQGGGRPSAPDQEKS